MTQYRRFLIPGATYFFTVRLEQRGATTLTDRIDALRYAYARAVQEFPVTAHAMVILPGVLAFALAQRLYFKGLTEGAIKL